MDKSPETIQEALRDTEYREPSNEQGKADVIIPKVVRKTRFSAPGIRLDRVLNTAELAAVANAAEGILLGGRYGLSPEVLGDYLDDSDY